MKFVYLLAGAVCLSACGGSGGLISSAAFQTASSGHAVLSDDISNAQIGTTFTVSATTLNLSSASASGLTSTSEMATIKIRSATEIELTINGRTDVLSLNYATGQYTKLTPAQYLSSSMFQLNQYASVSSLLRENYDQNGLLINESVSVGIIGFGTNPNALTATASYTGTAELGLYKSNGDSDYAIGTANLDANFGTGSLTGALVFNDPIGDGASAITGTPGSIDIGTLTMNVNGAITGNKISVPVSYSPTDINATATDPTTVQGGFYGPTGEYINGVGMGTATSADPGADKDIIHRTLIDAARR